VLSNTCSLRMPLLPVYFYGSDRSSPLHGFAVPAVDSLETGVMQPSRPLTFSGQGPLRFKTFFAMPVGSTAAIPSYLITPPHSPPSAFLNGASSRCPSTNYEKSVPMCPDHTAYENSMEKMYTSDNLIYCIRYHVQQ